MSCCKSCTFCARAFPKKRIKSRVSSLLFSEKSKIRICEKCFLCHSIVVCPTCNKCQKCCTKSACRGQTSKLLANLAGSGCRSESCSNPERGYPLPFRIRPKLTRSPTVIRCYVNPHRNLSLLEALHQLIDKNTVELVQSQKSIGFFNQLFCGPKTQQQVEVYTRSEQTKCLLQRGEIQNGDTGNYQNIPPTS